MDLRTILRNRVRFERIACYEAGLCVTGAVLAVADAAYMSRVGFWWGGVSNLVYTASPARVAALDRRLEAWAFHDNSDAAIDRRTRIRRRVAWSTLGVAVAGGLAAAAFAPLAVASAVIWASIGVGIAAVGAIDGNRLVSRSIWYPYWSRKQMLKRTGQWTKQRERAVADVALDGVAVQTAPSRAMPAPEAGGPASRPRFRSEPAPRMSLVLQRPRAASPVRPSRGAEIV